MFAGTQLLAWVGSDPVQLGDEHGVGTQQSLDAHRRREIGRAQQLGRVDGRQHEHREHSVGAVDESQALLYVERERRHASGREHRCGRPPVAVDPYLSFSHQHERDMGKGREITAAAERAVLEHNGCDAAVEQVEKTLDHRRPHTRPSHRQAASARQHHRSHHLDLDGLAHARRM